MILVEVLLSLLRTPREQYVQGAQDSGPLGLWKKLSQPWSESTAGCYSMYVSVELE